MPWLDGTLHPTNVVPFDVGDRGLLLGDGVFDTALVLAGKMVWRRAHVDRLVAAAGVLGFAVDQARVEAAIDAVLAGATHGALRVTCTRGPGPRGLAPPDRPEPTILASLAPLNAAAIFAPTALHLTGIRRNDTSPVSRVKTLGYLDAVLASTAARAAGRDDALFLNTRARVACTSVGNIFAVMHDRLVTPPISDGVVGGIVREVLLQTCGAMGLDASETSLALEDLLNADAVFVTNSLRLVSPVTAVGDKTFVTNPRVAAIAAHVARSVQSEVHVDPRDLAHA